MAHTLQRSCVGPIPGAGILFDKYSFSEPLPFGSWAVPQIAGVYAILIPDPTWQPKPFRILRFEEAANVAEDLDKPEKRAAWMQAAGQRQLFFSVHLTPFSTAADRGQIWAELVRKYDPSFQSEPPQDLGLVKRLRELETKCEQHDAQFKLVMAVIGKALEPVPELPKRRVGFI